MNAERDWSPWGPVMVRLIQAYVNLPDVPRLEPADLAFRAREVLRQVLASVPDTEPGHFDPPDADADPEHRSLWAELITESARAMLRVDGLSGEAPTAVGGPDGK